MTDRHHLPEEIRARRRYLPHNFPCSEERNPDDRSIPSLRLQTDEWELMATQMTPEIGRLLWTPGKRGG
jgi:hypothetical protein